MSENLVDLLNRAAKSKETLFNCAAESFLPFENIAVGGESVACRLQSLLILAGEGKSKEPLISYAAELDTPESTRASCFASSIGLIYRNNRDRVISRLGASKSGAFIFARDYDLNIRPKSIQLWSISFIYKDGYLHVTSVFGYCKLLPLLPYEILGAQVVGYKLAQLIGANGAKFYWYFHSIKPDRTSSANFGAERKFWNKIPLDSEVFEMLRLEAEIRKSKPNFAPLPNMPLSEDCLDFIEDVHKFWTQS